LNILFVNHLSPSSASFLRQQGLGSELAIGGHKVSYLARSPPRLAKGIADSRYFPTNITFWDEPLERSMVQNTAKLMRVSKDFELIHVNKANPFTSTLLFPAKFLAGKRVVMDWEDWDGVGGFISLAKKNIASRFALGFFEEVVPPSCDSIIAVSNILVERAEKKGIPSDRIFYVPNGFDEKLFDPRISGRGLRDAYDLGSKPLILLLSALHSFEGENFTKILEAVSYVVKRIPQSTLILAGKGDIEQIFSQANYLGIRKNIVYLGHLPHSKIPEVISAADVAVHILSDNIYFRSSSPMVVPEFMAMGKPIVASNVGELRNMLGDGAGVLVNDRFGQTFGKAILELLNDPDASRKIGLKALERARARYSYKILASKAEEAYKKALRLPRYLN